MKRGCMKRLPLWATLGLFLAGLLPGTLAAQDTAPQAEPVGHMMGVVYKKDVKEPYKNIRVALTRIDKKTEKGEEEEVYKSDPTDDEGRYQIKNVPAGVYKAGLITKSGKKPSKTLTVVKIVADQTLERSFFWKGRKPLLGYINCWIAIIFFGIILIL